MVNYKSPFKEMNEASKSIFYLLQKQGPLTKQEILEITNMKLTTLNRVMKPLEDMSLISEIGIAESTGGRKPMVYGINKSAYYLIGIDISRTYIQVVLIDFLINVIDKKLVEMDSTFSPEKTVEYIKNIVRSLKENNNIEDGKILCAGVGTVGPLDKEKGLLLSPQNFPAEGWQNVSLKALIEEAIGLPVFVDNGANNAIIAEQLYGVGKGFKNLAYFNCGVGIRTAVVSSSKLIRSHLNYEDNFAHMTVDMDGEKCSCGNYGCIECYSTILSITKKFIREVKKGKKTSIDKDASDINYKDICLSAENGDELSREILREAAVVFGIGLFNYINILNPEIVILSGPLIKYSNYFYETCIEVFKSRNSFVLKKEVIFNKQGKFRQDAISIGAAVTALEEIMN